MSEQKYFRGYISSRPVRGVPYPHKVQNLVVRIYAERRQMPFELSSTEYSVENCYLMLEDVVRELDRLKGIVVFSLFCLPKNRERRLAIYERVFAANAELHFALEEIVIRSARDVEMIEETLRCEETLASLPFAGRYFPSEFPKQETEFFSYLGVSPKSW